MFEHISPKTRRIVLSLALSLVGAMAIYQWVVVPLQLEQTRIRSRIEQASGYLHEITVLGERYLRQTRALQARGKTVCKRSDTFTLFAFVESLAAKDGLRDKIVFMRPAQKTLAGDRIEELVEMRLTGVDLEMLVPYLFHLETAPEQVRVKRLSIRSRPRNQNLLDVDIVLSAVS